MFTKRIALLLTALTAIILLFSGCKEMFHPDSEENGNSGGSAPSEPTISWSGFWIQRNDTKYVSEPVGPGSKTWQTLTITSSSECSVVVKLTASSYPDDYGYASLLDGNQSTSAYQFRVSGTASQTYTYPVPAGTHTIHFGFVKADYPAWSGSNNVTVEIQVPWPGRCLS
jgi:hypothetical protein